MDPNHSFDAVNYWNERYQRGETSGKGSEGFNYEYKRDYINRVIEMYQFERIVDFGCGDGNQIHELNIQQYHGVDIAESSIQRCRDRYAGDPRYRFDILDRNVRFTHYDLALSLDVLYHIVHQVDYESYLRLLFGYSKYTLIYANWEASESRVPHICYRNHFEAIQRLRISTQIIARDVNPRKISIGFSLFRNENFTP